MRVGIPAFAAIALLALPAALSLPLPSAPEGTLSFAEDTSARGSAGASVITTEDDPSSLENEVISPASEVGSDRISVPWNRSTPSNELHQNPCTATNTVLDTADINISTPTTSLDKEPVSKCQKPYIFSSDIKLVTPSLPFKISKHPWSDQKYFLVNSDIVNVPTASSRKTMGTYAVRGISQEYATKKEILNDYREGRTDRNNQQEIRNITSSPTLMKITGLSSESDHRHSLVDTARLSLKITSILSSKSNKIKLTFLTTKETTIFKSNDLKKVEYEYESLTDKAYNSKKAAGSLDFSNGSVTSRHLKQTTPDHQHAQVKNVSSTINNASTTLLTGDSSTTTPPVSEVVNTGGDAMGARSERSSGASGASEGEQLEGPRVQEVVVDAPRLRCSRGYSWVRGLCRRLFGRSRVVTASPLRL